MAVKFIAFVNQKEDGGWNIKLTDTYDNIEVVCEDLKQFQTNIEDMGAEYGNEIEVIWEKSPMLTPANYNDLEVKMQKLQEEYKEEIDKINNDKQDTTTAEDGFNQNEGFDPNA
jgi:hypothetical protein